MIAFKCSIVHEDSFFRATLATDRGIYYFVASVFEQVMQRIIAKLAEVESCIKDTDSRFCLHCGALNINHTSEQLFECMQALRVKNGLPALNHFMAAQEIATGNRDLKLDTDIVFNCPPVSTRPIKPMTADDVAQIVDIVAKHRAANKSEETAKDMADYHAAMRANDAEGY